MPEMRAETEREARRKGLVSESPTDPTDLTGMSKPPPIHRTEERDPRPTSDPTGSDEQPDPAAHEDHLRADPRLKGGATGGPS